MAFTKIKLHNFKGFQGANLELKPLTVILGPNSAGKSSFGQALFALSKNNLSTDRVLSLAIDPRQEPAIDLGKYADLIDKVYVMVMGKIAAYDTPVNLTRERIKGLFLGKHITMSAMKSQEPLKR